MTVTDQQIIDLIPALKRAAIDAYMCSNAYFDIGAYRVVGDTYQVTQVNPSGGARGQSTTYIVQRPGPDGEGGGATTVRVGFITTDGTSIAPRFDEIRSKIDELLGSWTYLPNPDDIQPYIESMRQASRQISLGSVNNDGTVTGGGVIAGNVNLSMSSGEQWAGATAAAFKSKFLSQLGTAIGGQHAISLILGGHLAAQGEMWTNVRQNLKDLIESTTGAFNKAASESGVDWNVILKIAGWAAAGVGLFGGAAVKPAVDATKLGLEILTATIPGASDPIAAPEENYESIMNKFDDTLTTMNTQIKSEEEKIKGNCEANLAAIAADRSSYDLARPALLDIDDSSDLGGDNIFYQRQQVLDMARTYLPAVASELFGAQAKVSESLTYNGEAWFRSEKIGIGTYGPSSEWYNVWIVLRDLLGDLGDEVKGSAETVDLVIADLERQDSAAQEALAKHAAEMATVGTPNSSNNPWDGPGL